MERDRSIPIQRITFAILLIVLSCQKAPIPLPVEFRIAENKPHEGLSEMILSGWGHQDTFYVRSTVELTDEAIVAAEVTMVDDHPAIAVQFSSEGAETMARLTEENVSKHLAMIVDGTLVSAPRIRAGIPGGRAIINGDFTSARAQEIADRLDQGPG